MEQEEPAQQTAALRVRSSFLWMAERMVQERALFLHERVVPAAPAAVAAAAPAQMAVRAVVTAQTVRQEETVLLAQKTSRVLLARDKVPPPVNLEKLPATFTQVAAVAVPKTAVNLAAKAVVERMDLTEHPTQAAVVVVELAQVATAALAS